MISGNKKPFAGVAGCLLLVVLWLAPGTAMAWPAELRILSYNTAFLVFGGEYAGPPMDPFSVQMQGCVQCDPFVLENMWSFGGMWPCTFCPKLWHYPNRHLFADVEEEDRARIMAERILATQKQQDVVVLNEVFSPGAAAQFVKILAVDGPYKHFISELRAPAIGGDDKLLYDALLATLSEISVMKLKAIYGNSGLMIFSRYPFLTLQGDWVPNDASCDSGCAFSGSAGVATGKFAFKMYDKCSGDDCLASKGVGLVKIDAPQSPTYVAFTHMQADLENRDVRVSQLATIKKVVLGAIPQRERGDAKVVVAGDLNIYGYNREAPINSPIGDDDEWHQVFNPKASGNLEDGFFACGNGVASGASVSPCAYGVNGNRMLTDAWGFETSTKDYGKFEQESDGSRYDFLLHSYGRWCMQRVSVAWDLQADAEGNGTPLWLSDHPPIRISLGMPMEYCSPSDDNAAHHPGNNARTLKFGPTDCVNGSPGNPPCHQNEDVSTKIQYPGSMQWFVIRQGGTYSMKTIPAQAGKNVGLEVFHASDLSRPLKPVLSGQTRNGPVYSLPAPPYYLRTFAVDASGAEDRAASLRSYKLRVHQHLCRTPHDACFLEPGGIISAPYPYKWPIANNALSNIKDLYFWFVTGGVWDGRLVPAGTPGMRYPDVRIQLEAVGAEDSDCINKLPPRIEKYQDPLNSSPLLAAYDFEGVMQDNVDYDIDGKKDRIWVAPKLDAGPNGDFGVYTLHVRRAADYQDGFNVCNNSFSSWYSHMTNLTYFIPLDAELFSYMDDDPLDPDDIRMRMEYDKDAPVEGIPNAQGSYDHDFWADEPWSLLGATQLRGYYVSNVRLHFYELDEGVSLQTWQWEGENLPYALPLSEFYQSDSSPKYLHLSDTGGADSDYSYYFHYIRCRRADSEHCRP